MPDAAAIAIVLAQYVTCVTALAEAWTRSFRARPPARGPDPRGTRSDVGSDPHRV